MDSGLSATELARRLGYLYLTPSGRLQANDAAVKAALGLKRCRARGGEKRWVIQKRMQETTALRYVEALGLDPVDIGL